VADDLFARIREAETALRRGDGQRARLCLAQARSLASRNARTNADLQDNVERYQQLMERTLRVTLAQGLELVSEQILDGMLDIVQARRGFVGLVDGDGWRIQAARNLEKADIRDPARQVSASIIAEALQTRQPVLADNAAEDEFAHQASVHQLQLRSVICLPLVDTGRVLGFVYLDDSATQGLFDDAAVAAVQSWLPIAARCLAQASVREGELAGLPGVMTRSSALRAELTELARIARFDVSVLLTGETGTGKSFIARKLHEASDRASGPFIHVNCGAIPEPLIESELFGHKKGSFTGANADKVGKFEAAEGGTLFLDELGSMPLSCQVKLLVVLQEKTITRLGENRSRDINVRVIAAMGTNPFEAIDEGRLREDLYYRIAVFVSNLPPLRRRPEDIPLLASHFLEQSRTRYRLPPIRLSDPALETLLSHDWPGNVRELANTLDRAALLARDGIIESISLQTRSRRRSAEASGLLDLLQQTARSMVQAMGTYPELHAYETADLLRSTLLLEAVLQQGGKDAGFAWLGLDSLVKNRNHHRAFRREASRLKLLSETLDEPLNADIAALCR